MVTWFRKRSTIVGGVAAICGLAMASLAAQDQPPVLLVLGQAAIDQGPPPHLIPTGTANDQIASVGLRQAIPYSAARIGGSVTLPGGGGGADGWFALRSVPSWWVSKRIVTEMIPQFPQPAGWDSTTVNRLAAKQVLVVGALTYDNEHLVNDNAARPKSGQPKPVLAVGTPSHHGVLRVPAGDEGDPAQMGQWMKLDDCAKAHP